MGLRFTVVPLPDVDEVALLGTFHGARVEMARAIAHGKCLVAAQLHPQALVLTADTVVVVDKPDALGKPESIDQAKVFLRMLQGRTHTVATGLALHDGRTGRSVAATEITKVTFAPMTEAEIAWYAGTGEPLDKAGAYAVQGLGSLFITGIEGDYLNVVGLPVHRLRLLIAELGYDLRQWMAQPKPQRGP